MLATVGLRRLDLFRTARDQEGKRKYLKPRLHDEDLRRVRACVLSALGMPSLTEHLGQRICDGIARGESR